MSDGFQPKGFRLQFLPEPHLLQVIPSFGHFPSSPFVLKNFFLQAGTESGRFGTGSTTIETSFTRNGPERWGRMNLSVMLYGSSQRRLTRPGGTSSGVVDLCEMTGLRDVDVSCPQDPPWKESDVVLGRVKKSFLGISFIKSETTGSLWYLLYFFQEVFLVKLYTFTKYPVCFSHLPT